jgi:hypothetical protein
MVRIMEWVEVIRQPMEDMGDMEVMERQTIMIHMVSNLDWPF